jgi:hypothetical protein
LGFEDQREGCDSFAEAGLVAKEASADVKRWRRWLHAELSRNLQKQEQRVLNRMLKAEKMAS